MSDKQSGENNHNYGKTIPEETRKKISESKKGKKEKPESIEKMLKKHRKRCSIYGVMYDSLLEAAKANDIVISAIHKYVNDPYKPDCFYIDKTVNNEIKIKMIHGHYKACSINGVVYCSATEASRTLNIPMNTISQRLKNPNKPDYFYCS